MFFCLLCPCLFSPSRSSGEETGTINRRKETCPCLLLANGQTRTWFLRLISSCLFLLTSTNRDSSPKKSSHASSLGSQRFVSGRGKGNRKTKTQEIRCEKRSRDWIFIFDPISTFLFSISATAVQPLILSRLGCG